MAIWEKLNPRERLEAIGAGLIVLGWIVSLASFGAGASTIALLGAIAVLAILYVKYTPSMNVTWPAPTSLIVLAIAGLVALIELIDLLRLVSFLGLAGYFGGAIIVALLLEVVGAALMIWGAWQEYQVDKPAMPNFSTGGTAGTTGTTAPPPAPPPAAPAPPPAAPAPPPASASAPMADHDHDHPHDHDHDEAPPA